MSQCSQATSPKDLLLITSCAVVPAVLAVTDLAIGNSKQTPAGDIIQHHIDIHAKSGREMSPLIRFLWFVMCYSLHFAVNTCINYSFLHSSQV